MQSFKLNTVHPITTNIRGEKPAESSAPPDQEIQGENLTSLESTIAGHAQTSCSAPGGNVGGSTGVASTVSDSVDQTTSQESQSPSAIVPLVSLVWNHNEPQNYRAEIRIGTEPVVFKVDVDTGSTLLWIQSRLNEGDPEISGGNRYTPEKSATSRIQNEFRDVEYGDGSSVQAVLYRDDVWIGSLCAKDQLIGAVSSKELSRIPEQGRTHGLMGLGITDHATSVVESLHKQGIIRHASVAIIGPHNDASHAAQLETEDATEARGFLVVGSVERRFYTGEIAWCPQLRLTGTTDQSRWIVKLNSVILNGQSIFEDQYALIDTGTSYIVTSPTTLTRFRHHVGHGARPTRDGMFAFLKGAIKTLSFVLGGRQISLRPNDISLGDLDPDSEDVIRSLSTICTLPLDHWEFPDDLWILGGIFIDNAVTIFDFGARQIGFADIS